MSKQQEVDYRVFQNMFRALATPKRVAPLLYDDHDREWMRKGTAQNRRYRRSKLASPALTKPNYEHQMSKRDENGVLINVRHIVNDYRYQREGVIGTNHERMLSRRATA